MAIVAGRATPAFMLTGCEGRPVSLKDFRGKHMPSSISTRKATRPAVRRRRRAFALPFVALVGVTLFAGVVACKDEGPLEKAGKDLDKARKEIEKGK